MIFPLTNTLAMNAQSHVISSLQDRPRWLPSSRTFVLPQPYLSAPTSRHSFPSHLALITHQYTRPPSSLVHTSPTLRVQVKTSSQLTPLLFRFVVLNPCSSVATDSGTLFSEDTHSVPLYILYSSLPLPRNTLYQWTISVSMPFSIHTCSIRLKHSLFLPHVFIPCVIVIAPFTWISAHYVRKHLRNGAVNRKAYLPDPCCPNVRFSGASNLPSWISVLWNLQSGSREFLWLSGCRKLPNFKTPWQVYRAG